MLYLFISVHVFYGYNVFQDMRHRTDAWKWVRYAQIFFFSNANTILLPPWSCEKPFLNHTWWSIFQLAFSIISLLCSSQMIRQWTNIHMLIFNVVFFGKESWIFLLFYCLVFPHIFLVNKFGVKNPWKDMKFENVLLQNMAYKQ